MRRYLRFLPLSLCVAVAGCPHTAPNITPGYFMGAQQASSLGNLGSSLAVDESKTEFGSLDLSVRWPKREESKYLTAAIPTTTNALVVKVTKGDEILDQRTISRLEGVSVASVSIPLKAANNLSIDVSAFREAQPDPTKDTPIARGTTTGINVVRSKSTPASITMDALFVPTVSGLSQNLGQAGDTVVITGSNFGTGSIPIEVSFNGVVCPTANVTRNSDTALTVNVPSGAYTGNISVKVDGIPSNSGTHFWVLKTLSISAPKQSWDTSASDERCILYGKSCQFTVCTAWNYKTGESSANYGPPPQPAWINSEPLAGILSTGGLFTAGNSFKTTNIIATLNQDISNAIKVTALGVDRFTLTPSSAALNANNILTFTGSNILSNGQINSLVTYSLSEPNSANINASGSVWRRQYNSTGSIIITATSVLDQTKYATASILLVPPPSFPYATTLAGGSCGTAVGDAKTAQFNSPSGIAVDSQQNVYVADTGNNRILLIRPGGWVSILAGNGSTGFSDGNGTAAKFNHPRGIDVDSNGNIYVADTDNNRIRKITKDGMVTTIAGNGIAGYVNGSGSVAQFSNPYDVTLDPWGDIYVADYGNNRIRIISGNTVSTFNAKYDYGINGGSGTYSFLSPKSIAIKNDQGYFTVGLGIGDSFRIASVDLNGEYSYLNQNIGTFPSGGIDGDASHATFNGLNGLAVDSNGFVYAADSNNNLIRIITKWSDGPHVTTFAGNDDGVLMMDGPISSARFNRPTDIAVDWRGFVYVADSGNNRIRMIIQ